MLAHRPDGLGAFLLAPPRPSLRAAVLPMQSAHFAARIVLRPALQVPESSRGQPRSRPGIAVEPCPGRASTWWASSVLTALTLALALRFVQAGQHLSGLLLAQREGPQIHLEGLQRRLGPSEVAGLRLGADRNPHAVLLQVPRPCDGAR